jgi:hypothetical protein
MKRLTLIVALVAVVGVWPATSSAARSTGVVVAKQRGALLVASPAGVVSTASGSASIGARVAVSAGHASVIGRSRTAHIRGVVVRRVGTTMFLSSNRHLVALQTAAPATTTPGAVVSSQVTIQNGRLEDENDKVVGQMNANDLQVQAVVAAVGPGTVTLTVGTQTLTVQLPAGLTLPASIVGQTVTLSVSLNDNANDEDNGEHHGSDGGGGGHSGHGDGGNDG